MQVKNKKVKEQTKPEVNPIGVTDPDAELIDFVKRNHQAAVEYRKKFKGKWDQIIAQIRCVHPESWNEKEDWQSKVFIPQQFKTSEAAFSYLDKMLFGQKRFYNIGGVEQNDKDEASALMELYDVILDRGNFYFENDYVMHEGVDIGSGFMKMLIKPDQSGIDFIWRSAYSISFDPSCGYTWKPKYVFDEYKRTINELVSDLNSPNPLYTKEAIQKVITAASQAASSKASEDTMFIKSIDGTEQVTIAKDWFEVNVVEMWGQVKESFDDKVGKETIKKYRMVDKIIVVVNDQVKIREDVNEYGFIPIRPCRIKPRLYNTYGFGFCENTVDMQDLTNSMINLGFDSLKLCSMDIAMLDGTKIKDPASIEYRPKATWLFKGDPRSAVLLTRQGISALGEIMKGLVLLDQFNQEATGVPRQSGQSAELSSGGTETLGEYQAKLAMVDNRFLKVGRFIERDYVEPLLKDVFKIIFNPKFFNQALIDRILGLKEVETEVLDHMSGMTVKVKQKVSKLDFNKISSSGDMAYDFKAVGMTQFTKALETLQKLKELLSTVVATPQLMVMTKLDELYKRVLQAAEIGDYQGIIKSDEEIKTIMDQIYQPQNPMLPQM